MIIYSETIYKHGNWYILQIKKKQVNFRNRSVLLYKICFNFVEMYVNLNIKVNTIYERHCMQYA